MRKPFELAREMLIMVARSLGDEILNEVAFVGGCTTSLLLTDDFSREFIRHTEDVDLIVDIMGQIEWHKFQKMLILKGYSISADEHVLCRMRLDGLTVDFMPHDEEILGFSNRWYSLALKTAVPYQLTDDLIIRVLTPPLFVATKLEAYLGRGKNDPMSSKDIEDIISIFDGRPEMVSEINGADPEVREYIADQMSNLLADMNFEYAVQGSTRSNQDREDLLFKRIEEVASGI